MNKRTSAEAFWQASSGREESRPAFSHRSTVITGRTSNSTSMSSSTSTAWCSTSRGFPSETTRYSRRRCKSIRSEERRVGRECLSKCCSYVYVTHPRRSSQQDLQQEIHSDK